jgi:hypothetical protein
MRAARHLVPLAIVVLCFATPAVADEAAGKVAAIEGTAEIAHGQAWQALTLGADVNVGDRIRTHKPGRVRITFRDDTTLNIGDGSEVAIGEHVFKPAEDNVSSVIRLISGKVRALVSEYYEDPLARYQIETATAVSGVRGTDFIVAYRDDEAITDVVDLTGKVEVHGVIDLRGHGVMVTPKMMTTVARGGYPTEPRPVSDAELSAYLSGLEFVGGGAAESMLLDSPIIDGGEVPPEDAGREPAAEKEGENGGGEAQPVDGSAASLTPAPPTEKPAQPGDRSSPAGVVEQPPDVVERLGKIRVEFNRAKPMSSRNGR